MKQEKEIDFVAVFLIIWDQKYLVVAFSVLFGIVAAVLALIATPLYRAQVVVTAVHDSSLGAASSLVGQLGGLASIAGLNLNANGPDEQNAAVLASRGLVEAFVKRYDLTALINGDSKFPNQEWFAVERFRKSVMDLHEEKLKGTTTITIDWKDPVVAARWANDFIALANEVLRTRAIQDASRNIAYLTKQTSQTTAVEVQKVMYSLIESETKKLMLANGRLEYAFTIVDAAVTPGIRVSPRRTLMVISGLFIGGFVGSLVALARNGMRRRLSVATN